MYFVCLLLVVSGQETQSSKLPARLLTGVYHSSGIPSSTLVVWQKPPLYNLNYFIENVLGTITAFMRMKVKDT